MKLTKLDTLPVKSLKEVFNERYTIIRITLKNNAFIELTQVRETEEVVMARLGAKLNGANAIVSSDNGAELLEWYEHKLSHQFVVDYSDPVKEAGAELYQRMQEWLV